MKKSRARFTVILASLFMLAACADTKKDDQPARPPDMQNATSPETVASPVSQDEIEFEEAGECHDPDCSPVAGEGVVLFSDDECRLHAVHAKTGKRKWLFASEKGADYFPVVSDGSAYVAANNRMYALDVKTGRVRWKRSFNGSAALKATSTFPSL